MYSKRPVVFQITTARIIKQQLSRKGTRPKFIDQRSSWAANAYEGAFRSGNAVEQCDEIANYILFEGLHFSKFDTVLKWYAMSLIP